MGAVASGDISHTVVSGRSRDRQYSPSLSKESPVSAQAGSSMGPGVMESGNEFKKSSAPYWLCGLKKLASSLWASVSSPEKWGWWPCPPRGVKQWAHWEHTVKGSGLNMSCYCCYLLFLRERAAGGGI